MTDTGKYKVIHRHTAEIAGTSGIAESDGLYTSGQDIQGKYHVFSGSSLLKRL